MSFNIKTLEEEKKKKKNSIFIFKEMLKTENEIINDKDDEKIKLCYMLLYRKS